MLARPSCVTRPRSDRGGADADPPPESPSDRELLKLARGGDRDAFAGLYERHVTTARRVASRLVNPSDVEDVVADAFARILAALRSGAGPTHNFGGYLTTAVRRTSIDRLRKSREITVDIDDFAPILVEQDRTDVVDHLDVLRAAFANLRPQWRRVLWLAEVEQASHTQIAETMQTTTSAVAALAFRARRALQDAYLREHVADSIEPDCSIVRALLPAESNNRATIAETDRIEAHVAHCSACRAAREDVRDARP